MDIDNILETGIPTHTSINKLQNYIKHRDTSVGNYFFLPDLQKPMLEVAYILDYHNSNSHWFIGMNLLTALTLQNRGDLNMRTDVQKGTCAMLGKDWWFGLISKDKFKLTFTY
jgi:hypothetical protein